MPADGLPSAARKADSDALLIRAYRPEDRAAVRSISIETAMRGRGAGVFFDDPELLADHLCSYYTDQAPADSLVAEADGGIVGYLFGCRDTEALDAFQARAGHRLIATALGRLVSGRYAHRPQNRRFLAWLALRAWRERPAFPFSDFPAHYHCNLRPVAWGGRLYSALVLRFLDSMLAQGVGGIHASVTEHRDTGGFRRMAFAFLRAHPNIPFRFAEAPSSVGRVVLRDADPMMNRVWGGDIGHYREFIAWVRERYRI